MTQGNRIARIAYWQVLFGLGFAVLGMCLGIYMASSQNHVQHVTHAHILLLGFVVSALYGFVYRVWLKAASPRVAVLQTALHQFGTVVIVIGLFLLYGGVAPESTLGPILGIGSICALLGAVIMLGLFAKGARPMAEADEPSKVSARSMAIP